MPTPKPQPMPVEQVISFAHRMINELAAAEGADKWSERLDALQEFSKKNGFESTEAAIEKTWANPDF